MFSCSIFSSPVVELFIFVRSIPINPSLFTYRTIHYFRILAFGSGQKVDSEMYSSNSQGLFPSSCASFNSNLAGFETGLRN